MKTENKLVVKTIITRCNSEAIESEIQKVLDSSSFLGCLIIQMTQIELISKEILTTLVLKKQDTSFAPRITNNINQH
jgi:hypothetical protein